MYYQCSDKQPAYLNVDSSEFPNQMEASSHLLQHRGWLPPLAGASGNNMTSQFQKRDKPALEERRGLELQPPTLPQHHQQHHRYRQQHIGLHTTRGTVVRTGLPSCDEDISPGPCEQLLH